MPHGQVQLLIIENKLKLHIGIKLDKFLDTLDQPARTEANSCRDPQTARGFFTAFRQFGADIFQLHQHIMRRTIKRFALLRQNKPARMAMKKRNAHILFQRTDLARNS